MSTDSRGGGGGGDGVGMSDLSNTNSSVNPYPNADARLPYVFSAGQVHPVTLKFEDVSCTVTVAGKGGWLGCGSCRGREQKRILDGITGIVCPGEVLAMLGPSGSGKTTLLTALGGRLSSRCSLSGNITYNDRPFSGAIKRRSGFVAQDDVLYAQLTVQETLVFSALLRLPSSLGRSEKVRRAQLVMEELGLRQVAHTMIGGPLFRGVSGGERKRVSIGQEMLVNPSLLLLDEPTSGLDSTTALRIMNMLRQFAAEGGRTVITTVHQPSSRIYNMFDRVLVLSQGSPIYYGQASSVHHYFSSIGGLPSKPSISINPAELLLDLANGITYDSKLVPENTSIDSGTEQEHELSREKLISAYRKNISTKLKAELCSMDLDGNDSNSDNRSRAPSEKEQWCTSWWEQFGVLLSRGLKERRHDAFNNLRIFQVVSVASLGGLLWWHTPPSHIQDRVSLLFFFSVFWGFYPLYNAVFTFPQERSMLLKEQASGMYRLSSYFLARTAGDLPMELALPTAFVVIIYWMGGLKPEPTAFLLSLLVVLYSVLVAQSLGLAVGAILMDVKQATTLASVTTLVFLIAGGYYVQQIPPFIAWFKYVSYSYYCYKLLLGVQFGADDRYHCSSKETLCRVADFPAIRSVGLGHMWMDVCTMAVMLVGYRLVAYLALQRLRPR